MSLIDRLPELKKDHKTSYFAEAYENLLREEQEVRDLLAASDGRYVWGWQAVATPKRLLLTHTGHVTGFMAEVALDRAGEFALFGLSNTGYFAKDGSSWVLARIDQTLGEVLKQQSIAL